MLYREKGHKWNLNLVTLPPESHTDHRYAQLVLWFRNQSHSVSRRWLSTLSFSWKNCLWQTLLAFQINKQNLVFTCLIGKAKLKSVPGVVTSYSGDYGWTEALISFNADVVTCGEPLSVWQTVPADVESRNTSGLKATVGRFA